MTDDTSKPVPAFDPTCWLARDREFEKLCESIRPENKAVLCDALAQAGITSVEVTFDGYGDSGQIEDITAKAGDSPVALPAVSIEIAHIFWGSPDITRTVHPLKDAIEQLAYDFLEQTHGGWENNDGAYGDITFDVAEQTITLDYNERYTSSENYTHTF
jgi:hypothetical protein